jgi:hypothetical protein
MDRKRACKPEAKKENHKNKPMPIMGKNPSGKSRSKGKLPSL